MWNQQSLRLACAYAQSDQSFCLSLAYSLSVKLMTEHHLKFLGLKGGCADWSESTLVKMPHSWNSHVAAQMYKYLDEMIEKTVGWALLSEHRLLTSKYQNHVLAHVCY